MGVHAKVSKGRSQSPLVAPAGAKPLPPNINKLGHAARLLRAAPRKYAPNEGKSRGVEDPFGRSPEGSALWWGAGAKPLLAEGEARGVQRGQRPLCPRLTRDS